MSQESKTSERAVIAVSVETKKKLDDLKAELKARTYDELFRKIFDIIDDYKRVKAAERVRKVVCNDMLEVRAALPAWARLLAKKLEEAGDIAIALEYLTPDHKDPGIYIVDRNRCMSVVHEQRAEETTAHEITQSETEAKAQIKPAETEAATIEKEHKEEAEEGTIEKYVKSVLAPALKEQIGDRDAISVKEFRKIIETLTTLPPNEVLETLVNLNLAEVAGNQIILKLR